MHRARLVAAVAVTFVLTSVAAAIAADQLVDGNLTVTGNVTAANVSADHHLLATSLGVIEPIVFEGSESVAIGTVGFAPGATTRFTPDGEFPVEVSAEPFMFTQALGGHQNITVSTRYLPGKDAFRLRLSRPAPAAGFRVAYVVMTLGAL